MTRQHRPTSKQGEEHIKPFKPTEWKDIEGYEGRFKVNELGQIKSLSRQVKRRSGTFHTTKEVIKSYRINSFGYVGVLLSINKVYKHYSVHRIVAKAFIPNPENKPCVNHKDGNKLNNHVSNLEWVTYSENHKHAFRTGLMCQKGERHASNKLKNKEVLFIFNSNKSNSLLASKFKVCIATVSSIKSGNTWSHVTGKVYERKKLTESAVIDIFTSTDDWKAIQAKYGVRASATRGIRSGRSWNHVTNKIKNQHETKENQH